MCERPNKPERQSVGIIGIIAKLAAKIVPTSSGMEGLAMVMGFSLMIVGITMPAPLDWAYSLGRLQAA